MGGISLRFGMGYAILPATASLASRTSHATTFVTSAPERSNGYYQAVGKCCSAGRYCPRLGNCGCLPLSFRSGLPSPSVQRTTRMRSSDMPITLCRRFWYSREEEVTVDEDGFQWLLRTEFTQHINAHVVDLAQLRSLACLALLGEPSSGKSTALGVCTEGNTSRLARGPVTLSVEQRLAVASRLAALTVLCGRTGIWLGAQITCADKSLADVTTVL